LHLVGFCAGGLSSNPRLCVGFVLPSKNAAAQKSNVPSITLLFYNYFLGFCFFVACISLVSVPFGLCHKDFPGLLEYMCLFVCRQCVECCCVTFNGRRTRTSSRSSRERRAAIDRVH
jgi:hypothetical protein